MAVASKRASTRPQDNPDLVPSDSGIETWRNTAAGTVAINRLAEYGRKVTDLVHGGRSFSLTPQERRMNQNACATREQDPFTNGTLQPISLLDSEPDTESLRSNPNAIADKDLPKLFKLRGEVFANRIKALTNVSAIDRLLEVARDPRHDVTLSQYEVLKLHRADLETPAERKPEKPVDPNLGDLPRPVTPR